MEGAGEMKPQLVALLVRSGVVALVAILVLMTCILLFQCLYWLRFDTWLDVTDPHGPSLRGSGWSHGSWRGIQKLVEWLEASPLELSIWSVAITLALGLLWTRISPRH